MLPQITIIGTGTMGEAIIKGLLRQSLIEPQNIIGADTWTEHLEQLVEIHGIHAAGSNQEAVQGSQVVLLSVKPQVIQEVMHDIKGHLAEGALVFSIAAGVAIKTLKEGLDMPSIIRCMPNTPAIIGEGITVWTATDAVSEQQREYALTILKAMGDEIYVTDEHYLDMATALSGSGPAYVFLFMEAMVDAGVHLGFSRRIAEKLVFQTVIGSANYARDANLHLAALRNQVTSPGGTTAEAMYHLDKGGFRTVLSRAIWAAYMRSTQLGRDE